jgi:hypothetical protein
LGRGPDALAAGAVLERTLNQFDRRLRVSHFDNQLVVPLVMQINDNRFLWIVYVPEDSLAVLIKSSSRDYSGNISSGEPDTVPPTVRNFGVGSGTHDVNEWNFQSALKSPESVRATNMQRQFAFHYGQIYQWGYSFG